MRDKKSRFVMRLASIVPSAFFVAETAEFAGFS